MTTIKKRTVDEDGRIIFPSKYFDALGIIKGEKAKVYLYYERGVLRVWNPKFISYHYPRNLLGIQIIEADVDSIGRLTIPIECRRDMGINIKDKVFFNFENGIFTVWNPKTIYRFRESSAMESNEDPIVYYTCFLDFQKIELSDK